MTRVTVDFELLWKARLDEVLPTYMIIPEVDVDTFDVTKLPILLFSGLNGHMISNGAPSLGWEWTLSLTLFSADRDLGSDQADEVYQAVHYSEGAAIDGVGAVGTVEDGHMFFRTARATVAEKLVIQYNAAFTVTVLPV